MTAGTTGTADLEGVLRAPADALVDSGSTPGVVFGAISGGQAGVVCAGVTAREGGRPMEADVPHELGSLSKTFTGLLLADLVARGVVGYADPVARYLPAKAVPADPAARRITLLDLATHTSGLPRNPPSVYLTMLRSGLRDPYAHYALDDLYRTTARSPRRIDERHGRYHYSTLGFGLLGQVLANAVGESYPLLLTERVLTPLGLADTSAELTPDLALRAATGHRRNRPVPPWRFQALAGAGAVRATGNDLVRYLRAHLLPETTPLAEALAAVQVPQRPARGGSVCLAWFHRTAGELRLVFHEGGTAGFTSFAAFCREPEVAVFVLANTTPTHRQPTIRAGRRVFKRLLAL